MIRSTLAEKRQREQKEQRFPAYLIELSKAIGTSQNAEQFSAWYQNAASKDFFTKVFYHKKVTWFEKDLSENSVEPVVFSNYEANSIPENFSDHSHLIELISGIEFPEYSQEKLLSPDFIVQLKNLYFMSFYNRLKSFLLNPNNPFRLLKSCSLALAGFSLTQENGIEDGVTCCYCGLGLESWEAEDIPLQKHREHSKNCLFLSMLHCYDKAYSLPPLNRDTHQKSCQSIGEIFAKLFINTGSINAYETVQSSTAINSDTSLIQNFLDRISITSYISNKNSKLFKKILKSNFSKNLSTPSPEYIIALNDPDPKYLITLNSQEKIATIQYNDNSPYTLNYLLVYLRTNNYCILKRLNYSDNTLTIKYYIKYILPTTLYDYEHENSLNKTLWKYIFLFLLNCLNYTVNESKKSTVLKALNQFKEITTNNFINALKTLAASKISEESEEELRDKEKAERRKLSNTKTVQVTPHV